MTWFDCLTVLLGWRVLQDMGIACFVVRSPCDCMEHGGDKPILVMASTIKYNNKNNNNNYYCYYYYYNFHYSYYNNYYIIVIIFII